jgi:hypothetical protein
MKNEHEEFYFNRKNYFLRLKLNKDEHQSIEPINKHIQHALDYFLDDLNHNRTKTIERFLNEQKFNEIFLSLAQLLTCNDER